MILKKAQLELVVGKPVLISKSFKRTGNENKVSGE